MRSVNLGRWSRFVERYFNMKGGGGLLDVEQSIRVTLGIQSGNENRNLEGWNRFAVFLNQAAVAGQFSALQFRNAPNSGNIAIFEKITEAEGSVDNPVLRLKNSPPIQGDFGTSTANIQALDSRQTSRNTALVVSNGTTAAQSGNIIAFGQIPTTTSPLVEFILTQNQEIVVAPGDALIVFAGVVNVAINVCCVWRERPLEASEFTG